MEKTGTDKEKKKKRGQETHDGYKENYLKSRPETIKKFLTAVSNGYKYTTCCNFAGISEAAFFAWRKRGKEELDNRKEGDELTEYGEFYLDLMKQNAIAEIKLMNDIKSAGENDWRSSAWILEHRFDYSKTTNVKVEDNNDPKTKEDITARIEALQKKMRGED